MSTKLTTSSRWSSCCSSGSSSGIKVTKEANLQNQKYALTICLHIRYSHTRGTSTANLSSIWSSFFTQTSPSSTRGQKEWDWRGDQSFASPLNFVKNCVTYFDVASGIIGWRISKKSDECHQVMFKAKLMQEIKTKVGWRQHLNEYGSKVEDKNNIKKYIFVDFSLLCLSIRYLKL